MNVGEFFFAFPNPDFFLDLSTWNQNLWGKWDFLSFRRENLIFQAQKRQTKPNSVSFIFSPFQQRNEIEQKSEKRNIGPWCWAFFYPISNGETVKKEKEREESCLKITIPHKKLTFDLLLLLNDCAKQCIFSLKKSCSVCRVKNDQEMQQMFFGYLEQTIADKSAKL